MPVLETKGALSAQGYGLTTTLPQRVFVEDVFSTYLYTGNGGSQGIGNGIQLGAGATTPGWISIFGGSRNPKGNSVAVDSSGNIYVCGSNDAGATRGFQIVKYDNAGIIQWQRELTDTNSTDGYSVAVSSGGNVYVCGTSGISGNFEFVVAKYNSSGSIQWQRSLGDGVGAEGSSIALDSSENVYISGVSNATSGLDNFQLAKYNSSGVIQWQRRLVGAGAEQGYGVAVDSSGNVYVCGTSNASGTQYDAQLAKYDTNGVIQWQRRLGTTGTASYAYSIALDSSANVYINGSFGADFLVAKYNTSGTIQWQRLLSSPEQSTALSIAVDSSANVYACGFSNLTGNTNVQIAKYDTSGAIQWQRTFGSSNYEIGNGVAVDNSGNIYITGQFIVSSLNNMMVAKLPADGSGTGLYSINGVSYAYFPSSLTASTSTLTSATSTLTASTSSLTDAASTLTDAATSISSTTTALVEGLGKGGLVWMKNRSGSTDHALYDTARGATFDLASNLTSAQTTQSTGLTGFLDNGFSIGSLAKINVNNGAYVSWTFREQPKFFDIVTWTGNGANRTIAHSLGSVPGCIMVKRTDASADWQVYHRSLANTQYMVLNSTAAAATGATRWNSTTPTATEFSLGTDATVNANGGTYVAYIFAHDAGGFGATGADNVISCGSYVGNGVVRNINLGYEPQWLLIRDASTGSQWRIFDSMRGWPNTSGAANAVLFANLENAETSNPDFTAPISTGFSVGTNSTINANGNTYIYIAIRRGPMRTPTTGTSVFNPVVYTGTNIDNRLVNTTIAPDMVWVRQRNDTALNGMVVGDRLRAQPYLLTGSSAAEVNDADAFDAQNVAGNEYGTAFSSMNGFWCGNDTTAKLNFNTAPNNHVAEAFRRAPSFFDILCYTGVSNSNPITLSHNLGVKPELAIIKNRGFNNASNSAWYVGHKDVLGSVILNTTAARTGSLVWDPDWNSATTSTSVTLSSNINLTGFNYVCYLFASCPGVSQVGTFTGTGATQTINCGFSSGARFVLIKRTDASGDWYVWDSARGIVAGNDPYLLLNSTAAEVTNTDWVDTAASGFELSNAAGNLVNTNGGSYIFLSIA